MHRLGLICTEETFFLKMIYFEKGIYFEDVQMLPRVFLVADTIRCMNGTFYHYIIRDNSIMTSGKKDAARVRDSISIYEQWFSLF